MHCFNMHSFGGVFFNKQAGDVDSFLRECLDI